jgi:tetratricopeptide (TPR) repeat protein
VNHADLAGSVVFCRRDQIEVASVVLSCLNAYKFVPVIVLDKPPVPMTEYQRLLEEYRDLEALRNTLSGTMLARKNMATSPSEEEQKYFITVNTSTQSMLQHLTPFRAWLKRRHALFRLIGNVPWKQAVFLFPPEEADLCVPISSYYGANSANITDLRLIHENAAHCCLLHSDADLVESSASTLFYRDIAELTDLAWEHLSPTKVAPNRWLEVPAGRNGLLFLRLFEALQQQVPLRIVPPSNLGSNITLAQACHRVNLDINSEEVVLVEESGGAERLLGVAYAHYRSARLVVIPRPDFTEVNRALTDFWAKQESVQNGYLSTYRQQGAALADLSEEEFQWLQSLPQMKTNQGFAANFSPPFFLENLRGLLAGWKSDLQHISAAVSKQVPHYVFKHVADRRLTVFTDGFPYTFVSSTSKKRWSDKPIGHVMGEETLLILSEIYRQYQIPSKSQFSLILDTEPYGSEEAEALLKQLRAHFTHTLLLSKELASLTSILTLGSTLPLSFIYVNTHGMTQGIQLGACLPESLGHNQQSFPQRVDLSNYKLLQWAHLPSQPVIFNNSCLSWIGVGQQFLVAGARAYMGTLWSVDAKASAKFAAHVITNALELDMPLAVALAKAPGDCYTSGAFIMIGTANTRLNFEKNIASVDDLEQLAIATRDLTACLKVIGSDPRRREIVPLLYQNLRTLLAELETQLPEGSYTLLDLHLEELSALLSVGQTAQQEPDREETLIEKLTTILAKLDLQPQKKEEFANQITMFSAKVKLKKGADHLAATELLNLAKGNSCMKAVPELHYWLSEIYKKMGCWQNAMEHASKGLECARAVKDEGWTISTIGQHVQLLYRLGDLDEASTLLDEGLTLARKSHNKLQELIFLQDQVRIELGRQNYANAVSLSLNGIRLARIGLDDRSEMCFLGLAAIALMSKGDLEQALKQAQDGWLLACELQDPYEQASFLEDIGTVHLLAKRADEACSYLERAYEGFLQLQNLEKIVTILDKTIDVYLLRKDWSTLVELLKNLCQIAESDDDAFRIKTSTIVIKKLKAVALSAPQSDARSLIHGLWFWNMQRHDFSPPNVQANFICNVLAMLEFWLDGNQNEADDGAEMLDKNSSNFFCFKEFVAKPKLME